MLLLRMNRRSVLSWVILGRGNQVNDQWICEKMSSPVGCVRWLNSFWSFRVEIAAIKQKEQFCKQSDSVHTLVVGSANQERELCYKQI